MTDRIGRPPSDGPPAPSSSGGLAALGDGRLALLVGLTIVVLLGLGLRATIAREETRDWIAYQQAADRLDAGKPLYVFDLPTPDDEYYLYPPPTAALWSAVGSPDGLLAIKLIVLALVGSLALVAVPRDASRRARWAVAGVLVAVAVLAPPDQHDLILGNVMSLYVGSVALSLAVPGWLGAIPLGLVLAAALKPVIGPYLVWLAIRRRSDAIRVLVVALASSAVVAVVIGPGRYVEYLTALPRMTVLTALPTGNVGLSTISTPIALVGLVIAYLVTVSASMRLDVRRSAAVAIAAGLLAQPTIGFNYVGLLIPAAVVLWAGDRAAGFIAFVAVPLVAIVSPPLAAAILIGLAMAGIGDRLGLGVRGSAGPATAAA